MLRISIEGKPFALAFKHLQFTQPQTNLVKSARPVRAHTSCLIYSVGEDGKVNYNDRKAYGISFCSAEDRFEKERGRRLSLAKAISGFSKEVKRDVFRQYEGRRILHKDS